MDSLYSYILWDKMGNKPEDYKIHEKSKDEIFRDFQKYILANGPKKFYNDVLDLSIFTKAEESGYHDGKFYRCVTPVHVSNIKESEENGEEFRNVAINFHDSSIDPMLLVWMMDFLTPSDVDFLASIHKEYHMNKVIEEKLNIADDESSSCSI